MLIKDHLPILDKIYRITENIPEEVPVEEIDIDSYFFFNILDIASCHNRIIRVSKGLSLSTFAIKKFTFYSQISVQSYFLSSEIHLNKKDLQYLLEFLPNLVQKYKKANKPNFIPLPTPKTSLGKSPESAALFLHYYQEYYSAATSFIRVGFRLPSFYVQKFQQCPKFSLVSEIDLKYPEICFLLQNKTSLSTFIK